MAKKITKWEPEDFELEMTTHWSFPKRGDWATHDAKWRGNWSPYIPRNILLRYSKEGDLVLDQFAGGGTTLVEAKLLNRNIIGVDVNDVALARCKEKVNFEHEGADGKVYIHKGDARHLDFVSDSSIDLICTHPPYADIIQYSEDIEADLSHLKVKDFLEEMKTVVVKNIPPDEKILELIYTRLSIVKEVVYRNGTLKASFFRDIWTVETCRKEFDKQEIQLYRDILTEGNEKGVFHIENVNLVADILHYSIKGIEIPYIRGLIGDGVPDEESKRCVEKLVFGALGKME